MPGLLSRRAPWPWDLILSHPAVGKVGLMLVPNPQTGLLHEKKAVTGDQVTPQVYDYGSYDPFTEKPYVFGRLVGGMGEAVQRTASPTRYKAARRADLSIGGMPRLGPGFAAQSLPGGTGDEVVQFLSAGDTFWAFRRRYAYLRASDTSWDLSLDFGAGAFVTSATTYAPVGAGAVQVYVAAGTTLWNYDAIAPWTACTLPAGMTATAVERNRDELWIAGGSNVIRKTTGDPLTGAGAWGGPIYVGDASAAITGLKSLGGQLFVFKTDGIYSVDTAGSVNDLLPELRLTGKRATNGSAVGVWRDRLWFRFGDGYYYLTGGAVADVVPIGPERLLEQTGIAGVPAAFVGHDPWFGYLVVHDAVAGVSRLLKYGTWVPVDGVGGQTPGWAFAEVWHGAIAEWAGQQVTAIGVEGPITTTVGTLSFRANPWLWVGFVDGSVAYTPLPAGAPDPAHDPACRFTTEESYVDWPDHHAMAQADVKHFRTFVAEGPRLDATDYVTIAYRTDPAAAWTDLGTRLDASGRRATTAAAGVTGVSLQVREYLVGTATSTPEVSSVTLLEQVRPAMILTTTATARAARGVAKRDGTADRRTGERVRAALAAFADGASVAGAGPITATFPDETVQAVDAVDYAAAQVPDAYGLAWSVDLTLVGFQTNTVFGVWGRARPHTWGEARAYTWAQGRSW